jgi:hypothetical protein
MKRLIQVAGLFLLIASSAAAQIPYAGIYLGDLSASNPSTDYYGNVAIIIRTNNNATLVGGAFGPTNSIGLYAQFKVQSDGTWSCQTNGFTFHGQAYTNGTFRAALDAPGGGVSTVDNGTLQDDSGSFQGRAGYYAGTWSGGGKSGPMFGILTALGEISYCVLGNGGKPFDGGGPDQLDETSGSFASFSVNNTEFDGVFTNGTLNIGGPFTTADAVPVHGHFSMTRASFVPRNLPPTITVPPQDRTVPYGATVTFAVTATGAAPLYYQWSSNGVAIAGATTRTLVISNVQPAYSGTIYSVDVQNFVNDTNVSAILTTVPETVAPTLSIATPTPGQRIIGAPINVSGHSSDNVRVDSVWYQLNGGAWNLASGTSNWSASVSSGLVAGTNVFAAYALDSSGNYSPTKRVSFDFVVTSTLTLITNGTGGITHAFVGNVLEVGRTYSVTAVPGPGQAFSNWVGSVSSSSATLSFVMQTNMVLQANFISNPFLLAKGVYNGLFGQTIRAHERSGFFTLTLGEKGGYSATLKRGTNSYSWTGSFSVSGQASKAVTVGASSWTVTMALDLAGAQALSGTVSTPQGVADLLAYRAVWNSATNPATELTGNYTLVLPGNNSSASSPGGDGYATVVVGPGGNATMGGSLSDSNPLNQTVALSGAGYWAVYVPEYGGGGSVWGWLQFDGNHPAATVNGTLSWIKPPRAGATYYPLGFTNLVAAGGSRYTAPANANTRVINLTDGVVWFDGGNLSVPFTNNVSLTSSNRVINLSANKLNLSITTANGTFTGTVNVPGTTRTNTFKGAFLQDVDAGFGYFLGPSQSGRVYFGAP